MPENKRWVRLFNTGWTLTMDLLLRAFNVSYRFDSCPPSQLEPTHYSILQRRFRSKNLGPLILRLTYTQRCLEVMVAPQTYLVITARYVILEIWMVKMSGLHSRRRQDGMVNGFGPEIKAAEDDEDDLRMF